MKQTLVSIVIPFCDIKDDSVQLWGQIRKENGPLDGLWEFPGGKLEANEVPKITAKREFLEEVNLEVEVENLITFKTYPFKYDDRRVVLYTHLLYFSPQSEYLKEISTKGWKTLKFNDLRALEESSIPAANVGILKDIAEYFKSNSSDSDWREMWQRFSC